MVNSHTLHNDKKRANSSFLFRHILLNIGFEEIIVLSFNKLRHYG